MLPLYMHHNTNSIESTAGVYSVLCGNISCVYTAMSTVERDPSNVWTHTVYRIHSSRFQNMYVSYERQSPVHMLSMLIIVWKE